MAAFSGALQVPVPAPASPSNAVSDPALDAFAAFLTAVLNADLQTAWTAVAPGQNVVQSTQKCRPEDGAFEKSDMPLLFVWRSNEKTEQWTEDWRAKTSVMNALWVSRPAPQDDRALRSPVFNGICSVIDQALFAGRHPAWIATGDTDPSAQTEGSVFVRIAGLAGRPQITDAKAEQKILQTDGHPAELYWTVNSQLSCAEICTLDSLAGSARKPLLDLTVQIAGTAPPLPFSEAITGSEFSTEFSGEFY